MSLQTIAEMMEWTSNMRGGNRERYKLSVILAVYNNGLHLYGKAFSSLQRSSIFEDMEILLVDDGSTDGQTTTYVNYLAEKYGNVRVFFFNDGGSGSASRPRNKGVGMASAKHITFLDPDDEAVDDGYAKLLHRACDEKCELVIGNASNYAVSQSEIDYYTQLYGLYGKNPITDFDGRILLKKLDYDPVRIQSMVIEKKLLVDNNLTQVEGAVGEDTLLSYQLMFHANRIYAVDCNVHIYYAAVEGSTVNSICEKYFQKVLIGKKARLDWLHKERLLHDYMDKGFNRYFCWLLDRLSLCSPAQADKCKKLLMEAFSIYHKHYNGRDSRINRFLYSNYY